MSDGVESARVLEFTGRMSTAVLRKKRKLLEKKKWEIHRNIQKIEEILAVRKYEDTSILKIAAKWDGLDRYNRLKMALEFPDIREQFEELITNQGCDEQQIEDQVCSYDWDDLSEEVMEIKSHFEAVCKK